MTSTHITGNRGEKLQRPMMRSAAIGDTIRLSLLRDNCAGPVGAISLQPARWQRIDAICEAALKLEPARRTAYLDESCGGDRELRRDVDAVLVYEQSTDRFLEEPALELLARASSVETVTQLDPVMSKNSVRLKTKQQAG